MDSQQGALLALSKYTLNFVEESSRVIKTTTFMDMCVVNYCGISCLATKYNINSIAEQFDLDKNQFQKYVVLQTEVLGSLRHPNIVQFLGVYFEASESGTTIDIPILVHEKLSTTLEECLKKYCPLPIRTSLSVLKDVALGLRYIHEQSPSIIHGSISASNVFLSQNLTAKLGGIGDLFCSVDDDTPIEMYSLPIAAELVIDGRNCQKTTVSSDIYSFGVLINKLLNILTEGDSNTIGLEGELVIEPPKRCPYLSGITQQCLQADRTLRPVAKNILFCIEKALTALPGENATSPLEVLLKRRKRFEGFSLESQDSVVMSRSIGRQKLLEYSETSDHKDTYPAPGSALDKKKFLSSLDKELLKDEAEIACQSTLRRQSTVSELQESTLQWSKCADLPVGMFLAQGTVINNRVYVGGGSTDTDNTNYCVYEYDPTPNCWQCLPPTSVSLFGLSQLENQLVIVGGRQNGNVSGSTFVFDHFSQRWKMSLPPLSIARHSPTCLSQDTTLIVCGGLAYTDDVVSSIEVIKTDDQQWSIVGYLSPSALLCHPSSTIIKDSYYLLGGYATLTACSVSSSSHFTSLETLASSKNPDPYMWHSLPDTPTVQATAACLNGCLLSLGGSTAPYSKPLHRSVYAYCPYVNSWELVGELPFETCHSTVVSLDQHEILLIGGWVQPGEFKRCTTVYRGKFVWE